MTEISSRPETLPPRQGLTGSPTAPVSPTSPLYDSAAENLRIAAAIEAGDDLTPEERAAAAQAIRSLCAPPRNADRDQILADGLAQFFGHLTSARSRAEEFHRAWRRYEAHSWLHERLLDEPPPKRRGRIEEVFWRALRIYPHVLTAERLRRLG
ncbi:hypothetical protein [Bradyrhizobium sp. 27S5]|uniref:hypothetical protein n=1 Tax=Bradyrhizobium sp. 27S5 TaxID=3139728 RepID=UPI0030CED6AA